MSTFVCVNNAPGTLVWSSQ